MVQTWKTSGGTEVACEQCGSRYERTVTRLPARDSDNQICQVCQNEMERWNSTSMPSYRLIEAKPWPQKPSGVDGDQ